MKSQVMYADLILIPVLLIGTCLAQTNLDDLISSIFDASSNSKQPSTTNDSYSQCGANGENELFCVNEASCAKGKGTYDAGCPLLETCCSLDDMLDMEPIVSTNCGYRNVNGVGFGTNAVADNKAKFGEFPWMVAILREEVADVTIYNVYTCGGSLITPNVVLTAAHCVSPKPGKTFHVRAGEWDSQSSDEPLPHQNRRVQEMIVHADFNQINLFNDIALLLVDSPFDLTANNVKTICLPPPGSNFDNARCFFTGWGKDRYKNGRYSNILKKLDLPVVPKNQCQENLRTSLLGRYFRLNSSFMCAGGEPDKDACVGDGGSPLVCPIASIENRFYQAGIVSWGMSCGDANMPGVYASVAQFRGWIDEQLAYKRIDSSFFTP